MSNNHQLKIETPEPAPEDVIKFFEERIKEVRALNWKEPFGYLMLQGKIETRTWGTKYKGLVLLCSSKQPYSEKKVQEIAGNQYEHLMEHIDYSKFSSYPGHAFAIGFLHTVRPMVMADQKQCFVQYRNDLHCHEYMEVIELPNLIEWKGSQSWGKVPEEDEKYLIKFWLDEMRKKYNAF